MASFIEWASMFDETPNLLSNSWMRFRTLDFDNSACNSQAELQHHRVVHLMSLNLHFWTLCNIIRHVSWEESCGRPEVYTPSVTEPVEVFKFPGLDSTEIPQSPCTDFFQVVDQFRYLVVRLLLEQTSTSVI